MPLNFDAGDESNENEVATHRFNAHFACMVGNFNRKKNNELIC